MHEPPFIVPSMTLQYVLVGRLVRDIRLKGLAGVGEIGDDGNDTGGNEGAVVVVVVFREVAQRKQ